MANGAAPALEAAQAAKGSAAGEPNGQASPQEPMDVDREEHKTNGGAVPGAINNGDGKGQEENDGPVAAAVNNGEKAQRVLVGAGR